MMRKIILDFKIISNLNDEGKMQKIKKKVVLRRTFVANKLKFSTQILIIKPHLYTIQLSSSNCSMTKITRSTYFRESLTSLHFYLQFINCLWYNVSFIYFTCGILTNTILITIVEVKGVLQFI